MEQKVTFDLKGFGASFCIGTANLLKQECLKIGSEGCGNAFMIEFRLVGDKSTDAPHHVLIVMDSLALDTLKTLSASIKECSEQTFGDNNKAYVYQSWIFKFYPRIDPIDVATWAAITDVSTVNKMNDKQFQDIWQQLVPFHKLGYIDIDHKTIIAKRILG